MRAHSVVADRETPPDSGAKAAPLTEKLGLPPTSYKIKFDEFMQYWRGMTAKQREQVVVYVYRLFPKINLRYADAKAHTNIAKVEGEHPYGGVGGSTAQDDVLTRYGLGDYWFKLNYKFGTTSRTLCETFLLGYKENLPGFSDFTNHPPLIDDVKCVVLDDDRNRSSGYITYLKSIGELPGDAVKENESSMADQQVAAAAMTGVMDVMKEFVKKPDPPPQPVAVPVVQDRTPEWDTIRETIKTVNDIHKENSVNPVELLTKAAEMLKPAERPDTTTPMIEKFLTELNSVRDLSTAETNRLRDQMATMQAAQVEAMRDELREMRRMQAESEERRARAAANAATATLVSTPPQQDKLKELAEKVFLRKFARMLDDEEDGGVRDLEREGAAAAARPPSLLELAVQQLPQLLQMGIGLLGQYNVMRHNESVYATGVGTPIQPGMGMGVPNTSGGMAGGGVSPQSLPYTAPPQQLPQSQLAAQNPNTIQGAQPNMTAEQLAAFNFLRQIEPSLVGALERGETGYDYAELFIRAFGRTGDYGYGALCMLGDSEGIKQYIDATLPHPDRDVQALVLSLGQYPPIWNKIGRDPRTREFLAQFVTYDELMRENGVANIAQLLRRAEEDCACDVPDMHAYLALPEETDEGDEDDREEGEVGDTIGAANGASTPAASTPQPATPQLSTPVMTPVAYTRAPKRGGAKTQ